MSLAAFYSTNQIDASNSINFSFEWNALVRYLVGTVNWKNDELSLLSFVTGLSVW